MKNKGFTLVELLGVIVIVIFIVLLTIPIVTNNINSKKVEVDETTKALILNSAKSYIEDNALKYPKVEDSEYCIYLETLTDTGYLASPIRDINNKDITNKVGIQIVYSNENSKFVYRLVDNSECSNIKIRECMAKGECNICTPVQYLIDHNYIDLNSIADELLDESIDLSNFRIISNDKCTEMIIKDSANKCKTNLICDECSFMSDLKNLENSFLISPISVSNIAEGNDLTNIRSVTIKDYVLSDYETSPAYIENDECVRNKILAAAKKYVTNHSESFPPVNVATYCLPVQTLENEGYLQQGLTLNGNDVNNYSVKIVYHNNFTYQITEIGSCYAGRAICMAVDNNTKTTGNVPQGNYNPGDEYECFVTDEESHHFFVLSTDNTKNKISLILDRNILQDGTYANSTNTGRVPWISQTDYISSLGATALCTTSCTHTHWSILVLGYVCDEAIAETTGWCTSEYGNALSVPSASAHATNSTKGPITALNALQESVKNWTNVPYITDVSKMNPSPSHYSMSMSGQNIILKSSSSLEIKQYLLRARFPLAEEITNTNVEHCHLDTAHTRCPLWLDNYLEGNFLGGTVIDNLDGYWTASPKKENYYYSTSVGACSDENCIQLPSVPVHHSKGIRPVIELNSSNFYNN